MGFFYGSLVGLELTVQTRLALNSQRCVSLCLLSPGIKASATTCNHVYLDIAFKVPTLSHIFVGNIKTSGMEELEERPESCSQRQWWFGIYSVLRLLLNFLSIGGLSELWWECFHARNRQMLQSKAHFTSEGKMCPSISWYKRKGSHHPDIEETRGTTPCG